MNAKGIENKAKRLTECLLIGCASTMIFSSCSIREYNEPKANLSEQLHNNVWNSVSLNTASKRYFNNNFISNPDSDCSTYKGDGYVAGGAYVVPGNVNIAFYNHKIGVADGLDDNTFKVFHTSKKVNSDKSINDIDNKSPKHLDKETMHYLINNKSHTFTLFQRPDLSKSSNELSIMDKIKYKLVRDTNKRLVFQPIEVKEHKDKPYMHIPLHKAKRNRVTLFKHYPIKRPDYHFKHDKRHGLNSVGW